MYTNMSRNRKDSRFFYTVLALIACILIVVAVVTSPSFFFKAGAANAEVTDASLPQSDPPSPPDTSAPIPDTAPPTDTTLPFDTTPHTSAPETEPPETSAPVPETSAPVTQTPVTQPPVTQPPVTEAPAPETEVNDAVAGDPAAHPCILGETDDAGQEYQDKIVFIGDSTTYSLLYYGKLNGGTESTQVWTPKVRTMTLDAAPTTTILYPETEEEITIREAAARKKPEIIVITLGVNGISYMKEDYFISTYKKLVGIIKEASPDTQIILQSIYPVAKSWEKTTSINNTKINAANEWIRTVADDCGVRYLDTITVLAVADGGYLPETYQNGDGLHLTGDACGIVLQYIRTHALPGYAD